MKQVTKENAELLLYKSQSEGFDYCFREYSNWTSETKGTALAPLIKNYREAANALDEALNELKEKYELEVDA